MRRNERPVRWCARSLTMALCLGAAHARAPGQAMDPATGALKPPAVAEEARFGVCHMSPRYRPGGKLGPTILPDGADDAHALGFRTIKVGLNYQVVVPGWHYYSLPAATIASAHSIVDLAKLDAYQHVFDLPFQTYFLTADAIGVGSWKALATPGTPGRPRPVDLPLTQAAKDQMYGQLRDLADYLLATYRGTGKVFVLQNHETDWHVLPYVDRTIDPSDQALQNAVQYFNIRQKAVDDARLAAGAGVGVYVYHLAEVGLVLRAMAGAKSVTNNVLPRIAPDLVGYSCWESSVTTDGTFLRALDFVRSKVRPGFAFGSNNVVVSEIGGVENLSPDVRPPARAQLEAISTGVPWVVQWTLYDNDAYRVVNGVRMSALDATAAECAGHWVRRPDGSLGGLFRAYQPYLGPGLGDPEPADAAAYTDHVYRLLLGRPADPGASAASTAYIDAHPWDKEILIRDLMGSVEYEARTSGSSAAVGFDAYRALFGRNPDPGAVPILARDFSAPADRSGLVDYLLGTEESRRRFVDWIFRRHDGRPPTPAEAARWLGLLRSGASRREVLSAFVAGR